MDRPIGKNLQKLIDEHGDVVFDAGKVLEEAGIELERKGYFRFNGGKRMAVNAKQIHAILDGSNIEDKRLRLAMCIELVIPYITAVQEDAFKEAVNRDSELVTHLQDKLVVTKYCSHTVELGGFISVERKKGCQEFTREKITSIPEPNNWFSTRTRLQSNEDFKQVAMREYSIEQANSKLITNKTTFPSYGDWLGNKIGEYVSDTPAREIREISWCEETLGIQHLDYDELEKSVEDITKRRVKLSDYRWTEILSRIDCPTEFLAWVWICVAGGRASSQVMWLHGKGNDGKSTINKVLSRIIDPVSCSVNEFKNQFTHAKFYKRRLACWNDSRSHNVVDDDIIFQVTGGDKGDIEEKGKSSFQGQHNCMILVTSNYFPKIDVYSKAHIRRLIVAQIEPLDRSKMDLCNHRFEEELYKERYHLLARAKMAHDKLCQKHNVKLEFSPSNPLTIENIPLTGFIEETLFKVAKNRHTEAAEWFASEKLVVTGEESERISELELQRLFYMFQERKGIIAKSQNVTIGYRFLRSFLESKGCREEYGMFIGVREKEAGEVFSGGELGANSDTLEELF